MLPRAVAAGSRADGPSCHAADADAGQGQCSGRAVCVGSAAGYPGDAAGSDGDLEALPPLVQVQAQPPLQPRAALGVCTQPSRTQRTTVADAIPTSWPASEVISPDFSASEVSRLQHSALLCASSKPLWRPSNNRGSLLLANYHPPTQAPQQVRFCNNWIAQCLMCCVMRALVPVNAIHPRGPTAVQACAVWRICFLDLTMCS